jgi:hypothetical protein
VYCIRVFAENDVAVGHQRQQMHPLNYTRQRLSRAREKKVVHYTKEKKGGGRFEDNNIAECSLYVVTVQLVKWLTADFTLGIRLAGMRRVLLFRKVFLSALGLNRFPGLGYQAAVRGYI